MDTKITFDGSVVVLHEDGEEYRYNVLNNIEFNGRTYAICKRIFNGFEFAVFRNDNGMLSNVSTDEGSAVFNQYCSQPNIAEELQMPAAFFSDDIESVLSCISDEQIADFVEECMTVTLTDEDGTECRFIRLGDVNMGDKAYVVCKNPSYDHECIIFRNENGTLHDVEGLNELEAAFRQYCAQAGDAERLQLYVGDIGVITLEDPEGNDAMYVPLREIVYKKGYPLESGDALPEDLRLLVCLDIAAADSDNLDPEKDDIETLGLMVFLVQEEDGEDILIDIDDEEIADVVKQEFIELARED